MNKGAKPDERPKDDVKPEGAGEPIDKITEAELVELDKQQSTLTPEK